MATVVKQKEIVHSHEEEDGTTTETREPVFVYVHCVDPACPEYHDLQHDLDHERKVSGLRVETSYSYEELGGDMPGTERSNVEFRVLEPSDGKCPSCQKDVNVSDQQSRKLARWQQNANADTLAAYQAARKVAAQQDESTAVKDAEMAEMRQAMKQQAELLNDLKKQIPAKRGPGRPRKDGSPAQPRNQEANDGAEHND